MSLIDFFSFFLPDPMAEGGQDLDNGGQDLDNGGQILDNWGSDSGHLGRVQA